MATVGTSRGCGSRGRGARGQMEHVALTLSELGSHGRTLSTGPLTATAVCSRPTSPFLECPPIDGDGNLKFQPHLLRAFPPKGATGVLHAEPPARVAGTQGLSCPD